MKTIYIIVLIVLGIVAILLSPFATIWSLNTLFGLTINYSLNTWLATVWLSLVTFGNVVGAINRKK